MLKTDALAVDPKAIDGGVNSVAVAAQSKLNNIYTYNPSMTGIEHEHYCGDLLPRNGWEVEVSQASNDQGVDIMIYKDGLTAAIQCKKILKAGWQ